MSYWLDSFDGLAIPPELGSGSHQIGLPGRESPIVKVPGGFYDPYGTDRPPRQQVPRIQATVLLVADTAAALQTAYDAWGAKDGKQGVLYRVSDAGARQWVNARLSVPSPERRVEHQRFLPLTLVFTVLSPVWSGAAHDTTTALSANPKTITVTNGGNAQITDPVLTITAAGTAITYVSLSTSGLSGGEFDLRWTGTLAVGQSLIINCREMSVRSNGANAYSGFSLGAYHAISDWARLPAGSTGIIVNRTGGSTSSTLRVEFFDGWA